MIHRLLRHRADLADPADAVQLQARQLLDSLQLPQKFTIAVLIAQVNRSRARRIELRRYPLPVPGPCGLLIAGADTDTIVYQELTTPLHQAHIILHELGHIVFAHTRQADGSSLQGEGGYGDAQEYEAELFATFIQERTAVAYYEWTDPPASEDYSFYHLFNVRRGWP